MRALILALLLSSPASAAKPLPLLEVSLRIHHSVQWTQIFHDEESGWYCATEHNRFFPLEEEPAALRLVPAGQDQDTAACREVFHIRQGKRELSGCAENERAFFRKLALECGRG
jgi:hypothetical protein